MTEEDYKQEEDHLAHLELLINSEKGHGKVSYQEQGPRY